jgi:hypothetical protein
MFMHGHILNAVERDTIVPHSRVCKHRTVVGAEGAKWSAHRIRLLESCYHCQHVVSLGFQYVAELRSEEVPKQQAKPSFDHELSMIAF